MPQTLVTVGSQYESVWYVQYPSENRQVQPEAVSYNGISEHGEGSRGQHILLAHEKDVFEQIV